MSITIVNDFSRFNDFIKETQADVESRHLFLSSTRIQEFRRFNIYIGKSFKEVETSSCFGIIKKFQYQIEIIGCVLFDGEKFKAEIFGTKEENASMKEIIKNIATNWANGEEEINIKITIITQEMGRQRYWVFRNV